MNRSNLALVACASFFLASCVSNRAVQTVQAGDQQKSCNQLQTELGQLGAEFEEVKDDSGITGKNIGLAVVFWPGIIVNEVRANKNQDSVDSRVNYLTNIYNGKCLDRDLETSDGSSMSDKLRELKSLFDEGLITEEEYEDARKNALSEN
tara:strand:- start:3649 stop:4098 length:450 start_codon:yes stop_codon:yes gene_type:complete